MSRRTSRLVAVVGALCLLSATAPTLGCGDGRPAFCDQLQEVSSLRSLRTAIEQGDLSDARAEARRLREVADDAPPEVRSRFRALAGAVNDLVELLAAERTPVARGPGSGTGTGTPSTTVTAGGDVATSGPNSGVDAGTSSAEPAEVERRREQLNRRLGELGDDSSAVTAWAAETCGVDLAG